MSEDQNTQINCLSCNSSFKRDRICISKQCSDQEYLKLICKMCHYQEHKSQGRLIVSELDIDVFRRDIQDLIQNYSDQVPKEENLCNLSKNVRQKIKESIKCLEKYHQHLEEFEMSMKAFNKN